MSYAAPEHTTFTIYSQTRENPFPGLRPFFPEESHLFFGREKQLDEVLNKLENNRFIAILGTSGGGKSSFMYCGLLPSLSAGFLRHSTAEWKMIIVRPGVSPLQNMAEAFARLDNGDMSNEEIGLRREYCEAVLKSSSKGLVELCKQKWKNPSEYFLILIDQFEELFRFVNAEENFLQRSDESLAYVRLITKALSQTEVPIYIVMTMRSDYIGDCARFPDLTEYINKSHYLIPQMTREQKRLAILGPIAVSGAKITQRLVQQLLNDLGDNQDQLPIMQHALMRTWDYWLRHASPNEPIDIPHYEAIGTMASALSIHAKEAFEELTENQKIICEKVFKAITEKGNDGRSVRRPTKLKYIAQIVDSSIEEVKEVIEVFRKPGRTLLTPMYPAVLHAETVVDISHESLMRIWDKLREWVEEEAESVKMYLKLSEAAQAYQLGKARLWRPPDLLVALNWREKNKPNLAWAQRHDPAFERAMVFLEISQNDYEEEQRVKDRIQKQRLKKARSFAIFMAVCVLLAICMLIYSYLKKTQAERSEQEAIVQRLEAEKQTLEANRQRMIALNKQREAQEQKIIAENRQQFAEQKALEALYQKQLAEKALLEAKKQEENARLSEQRAIYQTKVAEQQSKIAEQNALRAEQEGRRALQAEANANRLRFLTLAQSMAIKSLQFKDAELKALLAQQAYHFHANYQGNPYHPDILAGLYYAEKALYGTDFNLLKGHSDAVRAIVFDNSGKALFTTGSDGRILMWKLPHDVQSKPQIIYESSKSRIHKVMQLSANGKWLAIGNDESEILLYNAQTLAFVQELKIHQQGIAALVFSPDSRYLVSAGGDNFIKMTDLQSLQTQLILQEKEKIKGIVATSQNQIIYLCKSALVKIAEILPKASSAFLIKETLKDEGNAIAISPDNQWLAIGFQSGKILIWNLKENRLETELLGHETWISHLQFSSPNSEKVSFLGSASFDGTAKIWIVGEWDNIPIVFNDHLSWVWSLAFSPQADYVVTGCVDKSIRIYSLSLQEISNRVCQRLSRNMTEKEWKRFVGEDILYQSTCNR
ncbi:MAG: hypothetical protein NZM38_00055 [Cytophagales bacterium]|nr:hypothetical protein [Cytophagales bacterium]MDW8383142.1 hypothetical protein [Flammeovirgaceae bacterium]